MSPSFTWSKGSMVLTPTLNSSWNTNEMRAPPDSSLSDKSLVLPSIVVRNSFVNSVIILSTMLDELPSPSGPPSDCSSALYFCSCAVIRALMSGSVARMWCIKIYRGTASEMKVQLENMVQYHVEFAREEGRATVLSFALVCRMVLEKLALVFERLLDGL
jgi:hypothetical protein